MGLRKYIKLSNLKDLENYERMTVEVAVIKANEVQAVGGGKIKQEISVADNTGKATLVLPETDINKFLQGKSYKLNRIQVRIYSGICKYQLCATIRSNY